MRHHLTFFILFATLSLCYNPELKSQVVPILQGHSHNDYLHDRPLFESLENGMTSIEIDVVLVDDQIIVSHDPEDYDSKNTIQKLYFDPLKKIIKSNGGSVYDQRITVQLLVDIKTEGLEILDLLHKIVLNNKLLFHKRNINKKFSPLMIVLSGEVEREKGNILEKGIYPYFFIDGRCADLNKNYTQLQVPLISEKYSNVLKWDGSGRLKRGQVRKLKKLVRRIHGQGKKLRFWATRDNELLWSHLLDHGVDYINVDDLKRFNNYMSTR